MSKPDPETGPGNGILVEPSTASNESGRMSGSPRGAPLQVAFYGRTNQRGPGARTDLARQLHLCRQVLGERAAVTRVYYDLPEFVTALPGFTGIDPDGPPHAGGWDELAAAMYSAADCRDFEAVICVSADRISRRIPILAAREEFARRCGTPILHADELAMPGLSKRRGEGRP